MYNYFKNLVLSIIMIAFMTTTAFAGSITISWDINTESDLAGYKVYCGTLIGVYNMTYTVVGNNPKYVIEGLAPNTYYIVVTAYDLSGLESGYSNEVFGTVENRSPMIPKGCLIESIEHD